MGAIEHLVEDALSPNCYALVTNRLTDAGKQQVLADVPSGTDLNPLAAAVAARWKQKYGDPFGLMTPDDFKNAESWLAFESHYSGSSASSGNFELLKGSAGGRVATVRRVLKPGGLTFGPMLSAPIMTFEEESGKWKLNAGRKGLHRDLKQALTELRDESWPADRSSAYKHVMRKILGSMVNIDREY
jgi:hypothetical protein